MRIFTTTINVFRFHDWFLSAVAFLLVAVGFAAIYSVDLSRGSSDKLVYFPRQFIAFLLGMVFLFIGGSVHRSLYQALVRPLSFVAGILLVAVLFFGETIRGTTGWFVLGSLGSFQPAEFAKVALILSFGALLLRIGRRFDSFQFLFASGILSLFFAGLILLQPDLGSAAIMMGLWIGMLLAATKQKRYVLLAVAGLAVAMLVGWFFLFQPYQRERFLTFLQPERDPLGAGYNVTQSIIAVGAGRIFGRGLGFGSQSQLRFLPEAQTDFIFSVIAEELGFMGAFFVLVLYALLLYRLLTLARRCQDDFSAYTVVGVAWLFFIHIILNIGATIGLLPITGVTLPFLSYGGSSLLINFFLLGIVQSVSRSNS